MTNQEKDDTLFHAAELAIMNLLLEQLLYLLAPIRLGSRRGALTTRLVSTQATRHSTRWNTIPLLQLTLHLLPPFCYLSFLINIIIPLPFFPLVLLSFPPFCYPTLSPFYSPVLYSFMYLRAKLCTFQISVDFYYVPVSGRGGGRGGLEKGEGSRERGIKCILYRYS